MIGQFIHFFPDPYCSGQDDGPECHCGMFITNSTDEYQVGRKLDAFNLDNCEMVDKCKTMCADEVCGPLAY